MNEKIHTKRIRRLILTCMILVPAVSFLVSLTVAYYFFTTSIESTTIERMKRCVYDHCHMIDSFLQERRGDLEFAADSFTFDTIRQPGNLHDIFIRLQRNSIAFVDLGVFNADGVHVAYEGPYRLTGKVYKDAPWFEEVIKQGVYISDVFLGYRKIPHFIIAVARRENGRNWVIRATIDTLLFNDLVEKVRIGKTGEAYILNIAGIFQTERRSGGNLLEKDPDQLIYPAYNAGKDILPVTSAEFQPDKTFDPAGCPVPEKGIKSFIEKDSTGNKYLYVTTWLKQKNWLMVVRQEKADAFKAFQTALFLVLMVALIGGAVIISVAFFLTGKIVRQMEQVDLEKSVLGDQLIRASRLAELGEMAAGFAHEINNPLQIIKSEQTLVETILADFKESGKLPPSEDLDDLEDSIKQIDLQIERCSKITHAILRFGRKDEFTPIDVDLQAFIPEVIDMVAQKARVNGIDLQQRISADIRPVFGDPAQLQQVLLNLFNNALHAIEERHGASGGNLLITIKNQDEKTVAIKVKDNGCGINPEDLVKIFSPFYTTKPVGQGTGLGLSVCYGIIENMGGTMTAESEPGQGTIFSINLPASN
ncbi:MAG: two-component sensor histidine kinase [Deltaproteobacteria bacterium]|nr:two-component sensor histidine kinase [Deltaproteobacteria bacterium]